MKGGFSFLNILPKEAVRNRLVFWWYVIRILVDLLFFPELLTKTGFVCSLYYIPMGLNRCAARLRIEECLYKVKRIYFELIKTGLMQLFSVLLHFFLLYMFRM